MLSIRFNLDIVDFVCVICDVDNNIVIYLVKLFPAKTQPTRFPAAYLEFLEQLVNNAASNTLRCP